MGNSISKGFAWTAIDRFSNLFIQFVLGIIIARLITPEEYGILGILMVFVNVSQVFIDSGLGSALIYRNKIERDYLDTTFVFNLFVATTLYLIIFITSPFIESFYSLSCLSDYLRTSSIVLIINSLIVVPTSIIKIKLNFNSLAITNIISTLFGGVLGIIAAYQGLGVWALIIQLLIKSICLFFMLLFICRWFPKFSWKKSVFFELYQYGVNIFSASCFTKIIEEGTSFVIGKVLTPYSLGIYSRGIQFSSLPGSSFGGVITTALFPSLSSIKSNELRFNSVYCKIIEFQALLCIPAYVWLAVMAEPLVKLLITDKWIAVVPVIQILCLGKVLMPAANVTEQVLNAKGRSDIFFRQQFWKMVMKTFIVLCCLPFGLIVVVIGEAFYSVLMFLVTNICARKISAINIRSQLIIIGPYLSNALMSGGLVYLILFLIEDDFIKIIVGSMTFGVIYVSLLIFVCRKRVVFQSLFKSVKAFVPK